MTAEARLARIAKALGHGQSLTWAEVELLAETLIEAIAQRGDPATLVAIGAGFARLTGRPWPPSATQPIGRDR